MAFRPGDAAPAVTFHVAGGNDGVYLGAVTLAVAI